MAKSTSITDRCPMEIGINILSGKWKLLIIWHISRGTIRFNELRRAIGAITTKTLTQQLRELEDRGMIERMVYAEVPPKVEYKLTELGESIRPVLNTLCEWGKMYQQR